MTGNKIWRAPLAGLASLAMIATMGVTALSANASVYSQMTPSKTPTGTYSVKYVNKNGKAAELTTGVVGSSLADAFKGKNQLVPEDAEGYSATDKFVGWYADGTAVDYFKANDSDVMLTPMYKAAADVVSVKFEQGRYGFIPNDIDNDGVVYLPKNSSLPATSVPRDKADGQLTQNWKVSGADNDANEPVTALTAVSWTRPQSADAITVTINNEAKVKQVAFAGTENEFPLNAYADGEADSNLGVDAASTTPAPAIVSKKGGQAEVTVNSQWQNGNAAPVNPGESVDADTFVTANYTPVTPTTYYLVGFDSQGGNELTGQYVKKDGWVKNAPTPTREGYTFVGWQDGNGKDSDFPNYQIKDTGYVFYAKWHQEAPEAVELKVTFKDAVYDGSQKATSVKVMSDKALTSEQIPSWTREGYILDYWTADPEYSDTQLTNAELMDIATGEFNGRDDFTLTAHWTKVTTDLAKVALQYVNTKDEHVFTAASWKKFEPVLDKAMSDYKNALAVSTGNVIPADKSAAIVSALTKGWEQLQFKASYDNAATPGANGAAHRLHNGKDHFYSWTNSEIEKLVSYYGWNDEGRLFSGVKDGNWYSSFSGAIDEASGTDRMVEGLGAPYTAEQKLTVASELAKVATPIAKNVTRAYNVISGDHVWSVDSDEIAALEANPAWNVEGVAFVVPTYNGLQDVTRLYNRALDRHLLSTDSAEQANLAGHGWTVEGTAFKAY